MNILGLSKTFLLFGQGIAESGGGSEWEDMEGRALWAGHLKGMVEETREVVRSLWKNLTGYVWKILLCTRVL